MIIGVFLNQFSFHTASLFNMLSLETQEDLLAFATTKLTIGVTKRFTCNPIGLL